MGPLIVVVVVVVFMLVMAYSKKVDECWTRTARRLKLQYKRGSFFRAPNIAGQVEDFNVRIGTVRRGAGKNSRTYTVYRVGYPSLNLGLSLKRQGFMARVARFFGGEDIEIGHADFDDSVVIRGRNRFSIKAFLTPARRVRIHRFLAAFQNGVITDTHLSCETHGTAVSTEKMIDTVERMIQVAKVLVLDEDAYAPLARAMKTRHEGDIGQALSQMEEAPTEEGTLLKGEMLAAAGKKEEAVRVLEEARDEHPHDEEVQGLLEHLTRPPSRPVEAAPTETDLPGLCEALFQGARMSFESTHLFEEKYKGTRVRGSGVLRQVNRFLSDMVFGLGPGVRAVFHVHTLKGDACGGTEVQAVVRFPEDLLEDLYARIGERLAFEGTCVAVDAFMRNLFLEEGKGEKEV